MKNSHSHQYLTASRRRYKIYTKSLWSTNIKSYSTNCTMSLIHYWQLVWPLQSLRLLNTSLQPLSWVIYHIYHIRK